MLHDVTLDVYDRLTRTARLVVLKIDADGGDDAAARAQASARDAIAAHEAFKIIGIAPSSEQPVSAPPAFVEGAEVPDIDVLPDAGTLDEKAALIARAIDEGVSVDKRWGVARLREAIEAAQANGVMDDA